MTLNLTLLSGCFQFRQPHPTVARITAIHLTRVLPPHCGPDHIDPPHKGFATPLWPRSRRSTSQRICHPILAPDHVDPPHNGFATPSWSQITSIHLTRVLPPRPGSGSCRSTSQGFCHPIVAEALKLVSLSLSLFLPSFLPKFRFRSLSFSLSRSLSLSLCLSLSPSLPLSLLLALK